MTEETLLPAENIAGMILAGGQGARMGGIDKGLLMYSGKPLVEWAITRFSPQVESLSLNVNRNFDQYHSYGYPLLPDEKICEDIYPGPLVGIYTGLLHCRQEWLACIPCDVPEIPDDLVQRLHAAVRDHDAAFVFSDQGHYLCCLLSVSLKLSLQKYLMAGGRAVHRWFTEIQAVPVDFSSVDGSFMNINERDQL